MSPASQHFRFVRDRFEAWLGQWSGPERAIVALLSLLVLFTLLVGGCAWSWLAGAFALTAFVALQFIVHRHGGWHLLGPHFYYDVVRLARCGSSTLLRCAYIFALLAGLAFVFAHMSPHRDWRLNEFAVVSERFAFTLFYIQNFAVVILTPAYVASAIAEEKESRTLELLFATQLSDTEIILGKLFSRIIHLFGFVIAGFPILSLIQFWGGIDLLLIAGNLGNTLLNILTVGSVCLFVSTLCRRVLAAVIVSYAIVLPTSFCCVAALSAFPFVLHDVRQSGERLISVQDLGALCISHLIVTAMCLVLAGASLREYELPEVRAIPPPRKPDPSAPDLSIITPDKPRVSPGIFARSHTLPPMTDNALLWKERHVGGPLLLFTPIIQVPALPVIIAVILGFLFWLGVGVKFDIRGLRDYHDAIESLGAVLRFFYYVFLGCYVLGLAYRATASVARERQQHTLDLLLLLPVDNSEILRAKWLGSLMRGWPWLALVLGDIVFGTLIGAYHPFSAVLLCLAPWPIIFFFASLGLFLSIAMTTVLRANLVMVLILIVFIGCAVVKIIPMDYLEPFAFSIWRDSGENRAFNKVRFIYEIALMAFFFAGAAVFWIMAIVIFAKRARI
jgi:ABC-type transport system involved in multi-copper enzyme maturation permease subunit